MIARFIEPLERHALLDELKNSRDRLLVQMGLNTGLRVGSLLSLRWKQLVWDGTPVPAIEVPRRNLKGGKGRHKKSVSSHRLVVNETLRRFIMEHMQAEFGGKPPPPEAWVFASRKRWPGVISRQHAHAILTAAAARAGLAPGVAPHSLRRSFAGDLYELGGHCLLKVQVALAHSSPEVTAMYLRPEQDAVDDLIRGLPFHTQAAASIASESEALSCISGV
ncbi:tyrosine-type recombinase/integrase [Oleiharenicola lentus]|uniref:tyrosine-type recombinase/integrase n=1 Tax=Oleiharenicola lentus TaxID=2508720 RepID=UPI003F670EBA